VDIEIEVLLNIQVQFLQKKLPSASQGRELTWKPGGPCYIQKASVLESA
jgi:hypothetical protein